MTAQSTLKRVAFPADDDVGRRRHRGRNTLPMLVESSSETRDAQSLADVDMFAGDLDLHSHDQRARASEGVKPR